MKSYVFNVYHESPLHKLLKKKSLKKTWTETRWNKTSFFHEKNSCFFLKKKLSTSEMKKTLYLSEINFCVRCYVFFYLFIRLNLPMWKTKCISKYFSIFFVKHFQISTRMPIVGHLLAARVLYTTAIEERQTVLHFPRANPYR